MAPCSPQLEVHSPNAACSCCQPSACRTASSSRRAFGASSAAGSAEVRYASRLGTAQLWPHIAHEPDQAVQVGRVVEVANEDEAGPLLEGPPAIEREEHAVGVPAEPSKVTSSQAKSPQR